MSIRDTFAAAIIGHIIAHDLSLPLAQTNGLVQCCDMSYRIADQMLISRNKILAQ